MATPQSSSPLLPGQRYKGTRRFWVGVVLAVLTPGIFVQGLKDPQTSTGMAIAITIFWALIAAGLIWWGRTLKAQRIPTGKIPAAASAPAVTAYAHQGLSLAEAIDQGGDRGRLKLYVFSDAQRAAVQTLVVTQSPQTTPGVDGLLEGSVAAMATVIAEPTNPADPQAVRVEIDGMSLAYFSDEWKAIAHAQLQADARQRMVTQIPVVVRHWDSRDHVWAFGTLEDAQSFADWTLRTSRK